MAQGRAVLADLAAHPKTARHLATKLARHFVADDPPADLVDRLARIYLAYDGNLTQVYAALVQWDGAWQKDSRKFKQPFEFVYSAMRAFEVTPRATRRSCSPRSTRSASGIGIRVRRPAGRTARPIGMARMRS